MSTEEAFAPARQRGGAGAHRLLLVLAWLVPSGVLAQAVLAGQAWFVEPSLFGLHGGIGHGVLALAIAVAGLAWWVRLNPAVVGLAALAVLGLVARTGLGYAGRRSGLSLASSLHIPLGTLLLAATTVLAVLVLLGRRGPDQP